MLPPLSNAVTVTMFVPLFRGTTGMLQTDEPEAWPDGPWLLLQLTCAVPDIPVTVPEMAMEDVVTVTAAALGEVTVTDKAGGGVAVEAE